MKFKENIRKRWVAALRSGNYKQGKRRLRVEDRFCCLGVLCDIVKYDIGLQWKEHNREGNAVPTAKPNDMTYKIGTSGIGLLPKEVTEYVFELEPGEPLPHGDICAGKYARSLAEMNDRGSSFEEVAQLIEERI